MATKDSHDDSQKSVTIDGEEITPVDIEHERSIKVTRRMERDLNRKPEERTPEDVGDLRVEPIDVDHEHSLIHEAMVTSEAPLDGTTHDGIADAPTHREGEVWESMAPEDDDAGGGRRRVRVQSVEKGEVTAVNLVTGVVSHIQAENLCEPKWRRAHS